MEENILQLFNIGFLVNCYRVNNHLKLFQFLMIFLVLSMLCFES